ncbi:hypothetical protein KR044_011650 [Drosophila immigrans]|nr:hypothetical protein KR044_011650 [Drosophila immigrans]
MRAVKILLALVAILLCLPADVTAVTCDVAPLAENCINCLLTPLHAECLVTSTSTSTTASPVTASTTKKSRRRRVRNYLSKLFKRMRTRLQTLKKQLNPF